MNILNKKPTELQSEFLKDYSSLFGVDIESSNQMIKDDFRYYKKHDVESISSELEKKWYQSLEDNNPDYSVYEDKNYYVDVWCCWVMYSRSYIKHLKTKGTLKDIYFLDDSISDVINKNSKTVIDLGCGLGYSTAGLKEIFPEQKVFGYNIKDSDQYKFNEFVGNKYDFTMVGDYSNIGNIDTIFASEYFEHFERPIEHLEDIVKNLQPKYLIIANSFNTNSIGHFHEYKNNNEIIHESKISKRWNKELEGMGYTKLHPKIFNNKPSLFVRKTELPLNKLDNKFF
jgi:SAM-dependent methyltransferase